jgi:hypothetical protein
MTDQIHMPSPKNGDSYTQEDVSTIEEVALEAQRRILAVNQAAEANKERQRFAREIGEMARKHLERYEAGLLLQRDLAKSAPVHRPQVRNDEDRQYLDLRFSFYKISAMSAAEIFSAAIAELRCTGLRIEYLRTAAQCQELLKALRADTKV